MRYPAVVGVVLVALSAAPGLLNAQAPATTAADGVIPVPANVVATGLPPIPASIPATLDPYGTFRSATLLDWHPTQRQLLVQTPVATGEPQVHVAAGPGTPLTPLMSVAGGVTGGAWYKPGAAGYVLYRRVPGQETSQLFRRDSVSGETTAVTDGKARDGIPVWSPRGDALAFESSRRNGRDRDLYVLDPAAPDSLRMVMAVDGSWSLEGWSPDGRDLLALQIRSATESYLWKVNVETGAKTALTQGDPSAWSWPQYSPDGRSLFAVSNRGSELPRVWRMEVATGRWSAVTRAGDSVESCAISPDGRTLAVVFDRDASSRLELFDTRTFRVSASPKIVPGVILGAVKWRPTSSELAFTLRSVGSFGDVYSVARDTGAVDRWTASPSGPFDATTLPDPEVVQWKSFDGRMIAGVLYRPPARFGGPRPVIINIHGGPDGPSAYERPRFQGRSAYFLNELGVAIIYPNVRGSYGRGKTFEKLDDGMKREDTVKDIGALLDWIAAQPSLDKTRVLVTGASYGGYMTYAVAEAYGDRIRAAYAASGISNFITYFEQTDPARLMSRRAEYGDERDPAMHAFLTRISPVAQASKLRTPLLIAQGKQDSRVPVGQAEEMYRAARANGAPVWLVIYEDEGHDPFPLRQKNSNFHFYTWILFVQTYLLN